MLEGPDSSGLFSFWRSPVSPIGTINGTNGTMPRPSSLHSPYLQRRGAAFYFRYTVPSALTHVLGRKVLKVSLRTAYLHPARLRAASVMAALQGIIADFTETTDKTHRMDNLKEKLEALLRDMNGRWLDHHLSRRRPLEEDQLDAEDDTISMVQSDCMEALQTGNWRRWDNLARNFVKEHSLPIEEGSIEFRNICFEVGKLEARAHDSSLATLRGDFTVQPPPYTVPAPAPVVIASTPRLVGDAAMLLSDVYEEFCKYKTSIGKWKRPDVARAHDYDPIIPPFIALVGDKPLGTLTLEDVNGYASKTLASEGRALGTKKRDLDRVKAFLNYAKKKLGGPDVMGPLSLELKYEQLHSSYQPFSTDDLARLFNSEAYKSNSFKKASQFWLPLLGLYTGARIDEPASMLLQDIVKEGDIWSFYMSGDDAGDGGKNDYAPRWLPIHPKLLEVGFVEYVQTLKAEGHTRLFPDIGEAARDGFGKRATTDFTAYRRSVGVGATEAKSRSVKTFHSFRSTVSTELEYAGVEGSTARRLVGHEAKDVHGKVYLKHLDQRWLVPALAALSKLDYGLSHPKFADTDAYRKARKRIRRVPVGGSV